jgi:hypothetical protein
MTRTRSQAVATTARSWVDEEQRGVPFLNTTDDEVEHPRLHRDVQRGRRLVADQEHGVVGKRDGEHHPLALAAGELMGIGPGGLRRLRQPDRVEQLDGRRRRRRPVRRRAVDQHRLGDLVADAHGGVDRRHRLLEHHRDVLAADLRQLPLARGDQVVVGAHQPDGAASGEPFRQQTEIASAVSDLPEPDSPISPTRSPARMVKSTSSTSLRSRTTTSSPRTVRTSAAVSGPASAAARAALTVGRPASDRNGHAGRRRAG